MINPNIGQIILESDFSNIESKITGKRINGKLVCESVLQTADEKNRNGRYYAKEELFPQLTAPRTLELLRTGYLRAELGHPLSKELARQSIINDQLTCARFLKLWTDGDNVMAHAIGTNNEYGKAFSADLEEHCFPAWSLRALGTVEQTRRGCEVKNLRVITWDQVIYPSHPHAYMTGIVQENGGVVAPETHIQAVYQEMMNDRKNGTLDETNDGITLNEEAVATEGVVIPITNDHIINFIQSSSNNLKFVQECFDFAYSGIKVNESGTKVLLTTNAGDTLVINLESYIHNELMNYSNEYKDIFEV